MIRSQVFPNDTWGPTWQNNICSGYQEAFQGQVTAPYWASQITSSWLSGLQELRIVWAHEIESLAQASCKLSGLMVIAVITFKFKRFKVLNLILTSQSARTRLWWRLALAQRDTSSWSPCNEMLLLRWAGSVWAFCRSSCHPDFRCPLVELDRSTRLYPSAA